MPLRPRIHRILFVVLLAVLGASMTTSVWLSNLAWVMLGANWLLEGRWREKWAMWSPLLTAYVGLMLLHVVGLLWTSHLDEGLSVLQVKLPFVVLPLVMLTTRPPSGWERKLILGIYCATVAAVAAVAAYRLHTIDGLAYRDAVPHVSHIRFALNCCMVAVLCAVWAVRSRTLWLRLVAVVLGVWMLATLFMLRSYTGLVVLLVVPPIVLLLRWRRIGSRVRRLVWVWGLFFVGVVGVVCYEAYTYYHLIPQAREPYAELTANGRPYSHTADVMENGNYIGLYLCRDELAMQWPSVSRIPLDSLTPNGYAVEPTLVRYLNALGLTKDSAGIAQLSPAQVSEIERGVANPVYCHGSALRKMVYVMCFEHESRSNGAVNDFSMLQRFEQWRATWQLVKRHPWLGVGSGDLKADLREQLEADGSPMAGRGLTPHNQYLSLLALFGVVGIVAIVVLFARALPEVRRWPTWMLFWLVALLISFLTEDTLNTLMGILFATYFLAFRHTSSC